MIHARSESRPEEPSQANRIADHQPGVPSGVRKYAGVLSVLAGALAILLSITCVQDIFSGAQFLATYRGDPTNVGHAFVSYGRAQISDALINFVGAVFLGLFSLFCVKVAFDKPKWLLGTCSTSAACGLYFLYIAATEQEPATWICVAIAWFSAFVLRPRVST